MKRKIKKLLQEDVKQAKKFKKKFPPLTWKVFIYVRWNLMMLPFREHVGSFLFEQHARKFVKQFPEISCAEVERDEKI